MCDLGRSCYKHMVFFSFPKHNYPQIYSPKGLNSEHREAIGHGIQKGPVLNRRDITSGWR